MELFRPRGASIPRNYRQLPDQDRFSVTDAAQLKLKLQALDDKLERGVDVKVLHDACEARPFHEDVYVDGSEEFFLLVKGIRRAELIPSVYIEAYATLQQGRFPLNQRNIGDFTKGLDPTFSEVRSLLSKIDGLCGTSLYQSIRSLEHEVKPFPFLRLPAELRLQVYDHHIPRTNYIALLSNRAPDRNHKLQVNLDLMRVNHQLHSEVAKYLYDNRTLFMIIARDKDSFTLSDEYISRYYETLAVMAPATRQMFTKVELKIGQFPQADFSARRYQLAPSNTDHMREIIAFIPNLSTLVLTLPYLMTTRPKAYTARTTMQVCDTIDWVLSHVPAHVEILWDMHLVQWYPTPRTEWEVRMLTIVESRGQVKAGSSVSAPKPIAKPV